MAAINTPINSLPNELVVRIVEEIEIPKNESSPRAYVAISGTSRRLHQIIAPYLYKEYRQSISDSSKYFIRTLVENRSLASLVKCLRCEFPIWAPKRPKPSLLSIEDRESLRPKIKNLLGSKSSEVWLDAILENVVDRNEAHMAVILRLCPNLEKFTFSGYSGMTATDFEFLRWTGLFANRQSLGTIPSPLLCPKNLQRLEINHRLCFSDVIAFFKIPSLRELHLGSLVASESRFLELNADGYIEACSSSVQHLRLTYCNVEDGPLIQMIKASRALKTFEFSIDQPKECDRIYHCPVKISQALSTHKRTLETIIMVFHNSYPRLPGHVTTLPAFEQFEILHDLCITGEIIFMENNKIIDFVNHLPQSITTLKILQGILRQAQWSVMRFVCWSIISETKSRLPKLNRVFLDGVNDLIPDIEALEKAFQRVGIRFEKPYKC